MNRPPHPIRIPARAHSERNSDGALAGTPQDRLAKLAARRAFVDLKVGFLQAVAALDDDAEGQWLRQQVRQADEPEQLWLLRGALFAALRGPGGFVDSTRAALSRTINTAFPAAA